MSDSFPRIQSELLSSPVSSSSRKRSFVETDLEDSSRQPTPKKISMMKQEEFDALKRQSDATLVILQDLQQNMVKKTDLDSKIKEVVHSEISEVKQELEKERQDRRELEQKFETMRQDIEGLKKGVPAVDKQALQDELLPELKRAVSGQVNLQWKLNLIEEIKPSMPCLMLYGITLDNSSKANTIKSFIEFCTNKLGMTPDAVAKLRVGEIEIRPLSERPGKTPAILVKLGSAFERNEVLKLSHKLSKGESLDKYMPKRYLAVYKRLKNTAWKMRKFHNQHTQIDLNGHLLTLKHRQKDSDGVKYSWTIHEEWAPEPTDSIFPQTQQTEPAEGRLPTPMIKLGTDTTLAISGYKTDVGLGPGDVKAAFLELLGDDAANVVDDVNISGNTIMLKCLSKKDGQRMRNTHKDKKLFNCAVTWKFESEAFCWEYNHGATLIYSFSINRLPIPGDRL